MVTALAAAALFLGLATQSTSAQPAAAAQVEVPTASADDWKKILDKVKRDGVQVPDKDFFAQSLSVFSGDRAQDYEEHRVTVFTNKKLRVVGVEFKHEQGTMLRAYNLIGTDYWNILVNSSGSARQAIYEQGTHELGARRIPVKAAVVSFADPRVKVSFDKMIAFWASR